MRKTLNLLLALSFLAAESAQAQRVLECRFVTVEPANFDFGQWSFAADISDGHLHLLLSRPADNVPYVTKFDPLRAGVSTHSEIESGADNGDAKDAAAVGGGATADFDMATVTPDQTVTIDQWRFGGTESYDRLTLRCPSHP
jgi:hypothetical protein